MKFIIFFLLIVYLNDCSAIWCYRCTSATPGCAENFNWRGIGYWGEQCPESEDICVKVIERKAATVTITRECLSSLSGFRTDVPADRYEGCRTAAKDVRLGHYVFNNTIRELDISRDYFDSTQFCFCFLDHRCNGSLRSKMISINLIVISLLSYFVIRLFSNC